MDMTRRGPSEMHSLCVPLRAHDAGRRLLNDLSKQRVGLGILSDIADDPHAVRCVAIRFDLDPDLLVRGGPEHGTEIAEAPEDARVAEDEEVGPNHAVPVEELGELSLDARKRAPVRLRDAIKKYLEIVRRPVVVCLPGGLDFSWQALCGSSARLQVLRRGKLDWATCTLMPRAQFALKP